MPIRTSLTLDVADFEAGLQAAEVDLQTFAKATKNVNRDLQRLAESFSGEKIAAEAARTVKVIEDLGGAATLTEKEQAKVNATVTEAIAKYKALGQEAPADLRALASETSAVSLSMTDVAKVAAVAGAAILAVAEAARRGLMASIEYAGSLTDISAATGITTTDLQVLEQVMAGTPASLETIAKASTELSKALLSDKGAREAIRGMGLSIEALLAMNPADAFLQIGAGLAGIQNPAEQATAGAAIFGKTFKDIVPGLTTDMAAFGAEIRTTGSVLSEDLVAGGDAAGDELDKLAATGFRLMAETLLPLAPLLQQLAAWLGEHLPPAIDVAKRAVFSLIETWLELRISVQQTAADIIKAASDVPVLGRAFGASAESVEFFQQRADESRSFLVALRLQGVEPLATSVTRATPPLSAYGRGLHETADAAKKAKEGLSFVDGELNPLQLAMIQGVITLDAWGDSASTAADISARLADQMGLLTQEVIKVQPALANTFKTNPLVPFRTALGEADTALPGFFGKLGDGLKGAGINLSSLGQTFAAAFTGGGGALGAIQSFATQGLGALMGMIPLVGPFVSQFAGPIVAMLSKLGSKFKDFFGGVSEEEKKAREAVKGFESQLAGLLTATQRAEAGNDAWKQTVIAVRDAYIAAGKTEAEALAAVEKLWESSKEGAGATEEAIREISDVLKAAGIDTVAFTRQVTQAVDAIPNEVVIDVVTRHRTEGGSDDSSVPGYQHGSAGVQDFGRGTLAMLHGREAVIPEAQLQQLTAPPTLGRAPVAAAPGGTTVIINAQGALLGDPASQIRLRQLVSDALMSEARLRRGMVPAGGV